jgi:tetratricopeptide (TPR) repeat protein
MARIHTTTAGVLYRQGKATDALTRCQSGLELAKTLDADRDLAHAYSLRGTIHTGLGMLDEAIEDYNLSLDLCRALGDLAQQSRADNSLGAVYYYKGNWDQAVFHYQRSLEVAEQIGYVDQQATVANNLGEIYLIRGQFVEAARQFESCLATWRRSGFRLGVALSHYNLAQTRTYRQKWNEALTQLRLSSQVLAELGTRDWLAAEVHRLTAEVRLGLGQWREAWEECQLSLQIATSQDLKLVEGNARRVLGHWYAVQHQWDDAERELHASLQLAESLGMQLEQGQALVELALMYTMRSRLESGATPDIDRVEELLQRAATLFHDLGAEWHMAHAEALIRQP